ncbi:MAG: hypothetical protein HLX51_01610 [Micrococcaceae bacterium]|nr:hypothetical protein [Micrococcaceae bacterium]
MGNPDHTAVTLHHYFHSLVEPLLSPEVSLQRHQHIIDVLTDASTSTIGLRRMSGLIMTLIASLDPEDPHRNLDLADPTDFTSQLTIRVSGNSRPFDTATMIGDVHNLDATDPAERLEFEAIADVSVESLATYLFLCTISPVQAQQWIADDHQEARQTEAVFVTQALRYVLHRRRVFVGNDDPGTLIAMYEWQSADVSASGMTEAIANGHEIAEEISVGDNVYRARRISD